MWYVDVVYNAIEQPLCFDGLVDNEIRCLFVYIYTHPITSKHIRSNTSDFCVGYPVCSFTIGLKA